MQATVLWCLSWRCSRFGFRQRLQWLYERTAGAIRQHSTCRQAFIINVLRATSIMGCREVPSRRLKCRTPRCSNWILCAARKANVIQCRIHLEKGQDSSSMARELHLSSQPVQVLRHLEGTLGRPLSPWPQSMGSPPLLLPPESPAGEYESLQSPPWHAPSANPR